MRLLDLFCGAGGAAMGYHRAGFEVVGVDNKAQPHYPFEFHESDALSFPTDGFDVIHASPPCQHFTKYGNCRDDFKHKYENLLPQTREKLINSGLPYIIENVPGSPMLDHIILCGSMFGLDVQRHRLFECNFNVSKLKCDHSVWEPNRFPGGRSRERGGPRVKCRGTVEIGRWNIPIKTQQEAMGIGWIPVLKSLSESIPPSYTEYIGNQLKINITNKCTGHEKAVPVI